MVGIIKGKNKVDIRQRREKWINERVIPSLRANSTMNKQYLELLRGWQTYTDLAEKDPHQAQIRLPAIYSMTEQGAADVIKAFFSKKPWFPIRVDRNVTDPERKEQASAITALLQDFYDDLYSLITFIAFSKNVFLHGNCAIESQYVQWDEEYSEQQVSKFGPLQSMELVDMVRRRHSIKLKQHPPWRLGAPDLGGVLSEKEWFFIYEYVGPDQIRNLIEDYNMKDDAGKRLDPDTIVEQTMGTLPVFKDSDVAKELMGHVNLWGGNRQDVGILVRCFQNGREPYAVEYLNGEHQVREYQLEGRRWPIEWGQHTVEPRDNPFYSQGAIEPVQVTLDMVDDLLSNYVDITLAAFDPPTFYDARLQQTMSNVILARRARIPIEIPENSPDGNIAKYFHVERPDAPPDIGGIVDMLNKAKDESVKSGVARGEAPPASQTATATQALVNVAAKTTEARMAMLEAVFERLAEDSANLVEKFIPYHEIRDRIGERYADLIERLGASKPNIYGKFKMGGAARMGANVVTRQEMGEFFDRFEPLFQPEMPGAQPRADIIEFARRYAATFDIVSQEDIDSWLKPEQPPMQPGEMPPLPPQPQPGGGAPENLAGATNPNKQAMANEKILAGAG